MFCKIVTVKFWDWHHINFVVIWPLSVILIENGLSSWQNHTAVNILRNVIFVF